MTAHRVGASITTGEKPQVRDVTRAAQALRSRPLGPFHPCSKMMPLAAPPAGFEPAHTAPETMCAYGPDQWKH
jgi:hypothetical protein